MYDKLRQQLIRDEGEVLHMYSDSLGFATIGVGRLIDARKGGGISHAESMMLLENDINRTAEALFKVFPWMEQLDDARQGVFLNAAFNMGIDGLSRFHDTLALAQNEKWDDCASAMLDSLWAKQTGARAIRLAEQLRSGQWK